MKLRNKISGKVIDLDTIRIFDKNLCEIGEFYNLYELNKEWEDYKPKEPLIEHYDARKALLNWASTNQVHEVICEVVYFANGVELTRFITTEYISQPTIEFKLLDANVKNGGRYTIAELCGDE